MANLGAGEVIGGLLLSLFGFVSHFHRISRGQPGSAHQCRCSANPGSGWGIGIGHQPPQHPHTLDDARIQLVVDGLTALGLADGDLTGKGRVVPPPPDGLSTHAHLGCDVGDRMPGQYWLQGALLLGLVVVASTPFDARWTIPAIASVYFKRKDFLRRSRWMGHSLCIRKAHLQSTRALSLRSLPGIECRSCPR